MAISVYKDAHKGEEAWLFCKGESLDSFDIDASGYLRATVNEACHFVPNPKYCFTFHADHNKAVKAPEGGVLINGKDDKACSEIESYEPGMAFIQYSTAELAASYLIAMGVATIHLIGCDPAGGYSKHFPVTQKALTDEASTVRTILKNNICEMAERAGVTVYDYGKNN